MEDDTKDGDLNSGACTVLQRATHTELRIPPAKFGPLERGGLRDKVDLTITSKVGWTC